MSANFSYSSNSTPVGYVCSKCGKTHIKLWRMYQSSDPDLHCAKCAGEDQGKNVSKMTSDGLIPYSVGGYTDWTDQIGWYVPAIPDEEGVGYWAYTSVPEEGVSWWKNLLNK